MIIIIITPVGTIPPLCILHLIAYITKVLTVAINSWLKGSWYNWWLRVVRPDKFILEVVWEFLGPTYGYEEIGMKMCCDQSNIMDNESRSAFCLFIVL